MDYRGLGSAVIFAVALIVLLKSALFRTINRAFNRWARYKLNSPSVLSFLLAVLVFLAFVMGFRIQFKMPDWNTSTVENLRISVMSLLEQIEEASIYGVGTVFGILEGSAQELRNGYPNYRFVTWLLCIGIPILTVSTVLSVLLNFVPHPLPPREEYLIFSQVEENSILLAESMMRDQKHKKRMAIFLRTSSDKLTPEYETRLKQIRAKVYPYTEADLLRIHWRMRRKKLRFFFLSSDTERNFDQMKTMLTETESDELFDRPSSKNIEAIKKEEQSGVFRQELYLLSETDSAPLLIDNLRKELCQLRKDSKAPYVRLPVFAHTDLRLLDRYRTGMYDLLQSRPLYESEQNKQIRVLVLGFGRVGQAFFRAAVSFCSMAGYEISFCIRDLEIDRQWEKLILEYPQCSASISVEKENMNVQSEDILKLIDRKIDLLQPFTYIMLSLGEDERNITVASSLARHYRRKYWENPSTLLPTICVNLENSIKADYVSEFFRYDTPVVPLHVFGTDKKTFSENMLINRSLWKAARMLHQGLKEQAMYDFSYWTEYERRSSVACVAHAAYHVKAMEAIFPKKDYEEAYRQLSNEQKKAMIDAEHRRWRHYSRCEGMQGISEKITKAIVKKKGTHVDTIARLTPCMVDTNELESLFRKLYLENDSLPAGVQPPQRTFYERDRFVVSNAARLVKIINNDADPVALLRFEEDITKRKR